MNLGKVKTFLIVLFLGINIYLLISLLTSTRFYIDDDTIKETVEILNRNGIEIEEDTIIKSVENLKNVDTNNIIYTDKFKNSNQKDVFVIENDAFSGRKSFSGIYSQSDSKIKNTVKDYLEELGISEDYMKIGNISSGKDKEKVFYVSCTIGKYRVFDSTVKVTVLPDDEVVIEGTWYEPASDDIKLRTRTRDTVYITSVLVSMLQNDEIMDRAPFKIVSIEYGYLAGTSYGGGTHVKTSALPYYRIKDNKGKVYYYDAQNGTYLK